MKKVLFLTMTLLLILGILLCGTVYAADTGGNDAADITNLINGLSVYSVTIIGIVGALAFVVEVIVHVTKEVPPIGKLPTKLWVIIVSLIVCELALFIYAAWANLTVLWYYIVLAFFMSFVVSYISMYGWDTLKELYLRYTKFKQ